MASMPASAETVPSWLGSTVPLVDPVKSVVVVRILMLTFAVSWVVYRIWLIHRKPVGELISVLGLDIPPAPEVALTGIRQNSVKLQWADCGSSVSRFLVKLDGDIVGAVNRSTTSISVHGLESDTPYQIQITSISSSAFESDSNYINICTLPDPLANGSVAVASASSTGVSTGHEQSNAEQVIQQREPYVEITNATAPPMTRENSGNTSQSRRQGSQRRNSPSVPGIDGDVLRDLPDDKDPLNEDINPEDSLPELTRHLESLQRELTDTQLQNHRDDEDFIAARDTEVLKRDQLKQTIQGRENSSAELRKDFNRLDRHNKTILKEKRDKDHELQSKMAERKKLDEDIVRWDKDIVNFKRKRERLEKEKRQATEAFERKIADLRKQMQEEQGDTPSIDEDIKEKSSQIRKMENDRKKLGFDVESPEATDRVRGEREKEAYWAKRQAELRGQYANINSAYEKADSEYKEAQQSFNYVQGSFNMQNQRLMQSAAEGDPAMAKKTKNRRARQRKSRSNTGSSSEAGAAPMMPAPSSSPATYTSQPAFYSGIGPSAAFQRDQGTASTVGDPMPTPGLTPMSPSARDYLPSGLLGDDDTSSYSGMLNSHMSSSSGMTGQPPTLLSQLSMDSQYPDPNSPNSAGSRPHSLLPSPQESQNNIASYPTSSELYPDPDRRSISSAQAALGAIDEATDNVSGPRKFPASLFGTFARRDKAPALEGFAIGSLKPGQSQSFPRDYQSDSKQQDPIGTRARSGSQSTLGMLRKFGRSPSTLADSPEGNAPAGARSNTGRRNRYDPFRSESDPLEPSAFLTGGRMSSSRAGSISSQIDSGRPSTESAGRMPWLSDSSSMGGSRDWHAGSDIWASRSISRQQSLGQNPSGSTLSLGQSSLGPSKEDLEGPDPNSPIAPIGTKPKSFAQRAKLNPNAPAFSLNPFNRSDPKKAENAEKKKKGKEKSKVSKEDKIEKDLPASSIEDSPPSTRRSRDSRSINTEASQAESHESLDRSISGTPSDTGGASTPSAIPGRETFIQKLTRKSSSSKFNIGWKDKGGLFGKKSTNDLDAAGATIATSGTVEEAAAEGSGESTFGKSVDSVTSSPNVGTLTDAKGRKGWGMLSRKRRGDKAASEASEKASETGDDEEDK